MPAAAVEEMPAAAEDREEGGAPEDREAPVVPAAVEEGGAPEDRDELMVPAAVVEGDAPLCRRSGRKRKRNQMFDSP